MKTLTAATKKLAAKPKTPAPIACDCCAKREGDWTTFCVDCDETSWAEGAFDALKEATRHLAIAKDLERDPRRRRALVLLALTDIATATHYLDRVGVAPREDALAEFNRYLDGFKKGRA